MNAERAGFRSVTFYLGLLTETVSWARVHHIRGELASLNRKLARLSERVDADHVRSGEDVRKVVLVELNAFMVVMAEMFRPAPMAEIEEILDEELDGGLSSLLEAHDAEIGGLPVSEPRAAAELEAALVSSLLAFSRSLKLVALKEAISAIEDLCALRLTTELLETTDLLVERERFANTLRRFPPTLRDLIASSVAERLGGMAPQDGMRVGRGGRGIVDPSVVEMVRPRTDEVEESADVARWLVPGARQQFLDRYANRVAEHEAEVAERRARDERVREMDQRSLHASSLDDSATPPGAPDAAPVSGESVGSPSAPRTQQARDQRRDQRLPAPPFPPARPDPGLVPGSKPSFFISA